MNPCVNSDNLIQIRFHDHPISQDVHRKCVSYSCWFLQNLRKPNQMTPDEWGWCRALISGSCLMSCSSSSDHSSLILNGCQPRTIVAFYPCYHVVIPALENKVNQEKIQGGSRPHSDTREGKCKGWRQIHRHDPALVTAWNTQPASSYSPYL